MDYATVPLALPGRSMFCLFCVGVAYAELMKYDRALVNYQLATAFNPNCAEAYNNMGVIYKDRENPDQAIACYKKALAIRPDFAQTLNNLGVLYTCTGKVCASISSTHTRNIYISLYVFIQVYASMKAFRTRDDLYSSTDQCQHIFYGRRCTGCLPFISDLVVSDKRL